MPGDAITMPAFGKARSVAIRLLFKEITKAARQGNIPDMDNH
jgi:hypothetical protein